MTVLSPGDLPTPASSSRFLKATRKLHHRANSSSTTNVNLSELDHDDRSEKGYSSDSGFFSNFFRKARRLGKPKSKKISHALLSGLPADVLVPVITVDTPESAGATIAQESETVQLPQPEDGIPPPQPPISNPTGSRNTDQPLLLVDSTLRHDIFPSDTPKPTVRSRTPIHPRARMESTLQLVFCARLLLEDQRRSTTQSNPTGVGVLDDAVRHYLDAIKEDLSAQARIRLLLSRLVKEFLKDPSLGPEAISEVVVLGPVLCEVDYRDLLSCFVERFDQCAMLNPSLLQGMIQLLQSAPSGFLTDDDLVRIVSSLRKRLESTHAPDRAHVYQLVFAVSKVLEAMVRGKVKGLNRQRDHQSLLDALRSLKGVDDDEFLKFQVSYAYQMSLYLPDDETSFQAFWRYAESVAVGVSAVASVFKLDPMSALAAVEHIQQVAGNAIDVVKFSIDGVLSFQATAEEATQAAEKACWSQKKQPWFLALQAGYLFVQEGRLVDFNVLVCAAIHRYNANFQRGVCQILGEIALNPLWDDESRRNAVDFLGELCKTDSGRRNDFKVRKWVATILQQISSSASPAVSGHARTLLDDLQQKHALDIEGCCALNTLLPIPTVFPLLERALDITDIDHELACIRFRSLEECLHPVSISLRAKATLQASEDQSFPLMEKVLEFLRSEKLVFLLLGDSGSGKSTFCRQLERELWNQHQHSDGSRIPLYINLPSIDDPHCGLIEKYLRVHHNILESTIQNIKDRRQFVLICDGYDESRLIRNLYTSNRLNRPGQWNVKMIITCRSTFLGPDYQCRFYPLEDDKYHDKSFELFEEATIVPFQKSDIQEFIKQYFLDVIAQEPSDNPSAPSFDDYCKTLNVIPDMMDLVSNPFLLTLALRALPSLSNDLQDLAKIKATRLKLYDGFIRDWVGLHLKRLEGTILKQDIRTAFDNLLREGYARCVTGYLKRLADAIYKYQDGRPVVKFSRRHMEDWKVEFFGPEIETTLLRDASPLTRAGIRHWFIHKSLLDYFYNLTIYDPDDSDDDDSDDGEDSDDDSRGGGDDFQSGGENSLGDGGDGLADDNGDSAGGNGGSTGGNAESTGNNDGSSGGNGGNGGSSGGNGGSTSGNQDSAGGISNSSGGSSGSSSGDNNDGSRGDKNGSNGDKDGSRQRKDDARSKRKGNATKFRPSTSSDPFSKRNLFKEPSVMQFLVERAESDPRLKKRLFSAIERSKASSVPSMAAANAIAILFKSGNLSQDAVLEGVPTPSDYMSTATGSTEPVQLPESTLTGGDLMKVLVTLTTSEGHVKWVCRDHYRTGYQEKHVQKLRDVVKLAQGEFDEQLGKITLTLRSSFAAAEFYSAVIKAKSVLELVMELRWECTWNDLEALHDALKKSGVPVLRLDLGQFGTSLGRSTISKMIPTSRFKPLYRIIELRSMKTIHVVLPRDFVILSDFHPKRPSHLSELSFELVPGSFGAKELESLAEALKTNSTLTTLDLRGNKIGSHEVQLMAEALKTNSTLTTLNLSDNSIGDNGAQALSEALKTNSTLTTLDLTTNSIGPNGAQALSEVLKTNSTLTTLDLQSNSIGDNGAQALSEALKTNSTLTTLNLTTNSIGSNGAQALSEALKTNSTLTTLNLTTNSIGSNGAQALSEALKTNSTLTTLNLTTNSIGPNGAQALSKALKTNSTLTTLNLKLNLIGDNGAQALSEALKTNSTLTNLDLNYNSIGDNGAQALSEALKTNSTLTIIGVQFTKQT